MQQVDGSDPQMKRCYEPLLMRWSKVQRDNEDATGRLQTWRWYVMCRHKRNGHGCVEILTFIGLIALLDSAILNSEYGDDLDG